MRFTLILLLLLLTVPGPLAQGNGNGPPAHSNAGGNGNGNGNDRPDQAANGNGSGQNNGNGHGPGQNNGNGNGQDGDQRPGSGNGQGNGSGSGNAAEPQPGAVSADGGRVILPIGTASDPAAVVPQPTESAGHAIAAGRAVSLSSLLPDLHARAPGEVIDAELLKVSGFLIYSVRVLRTNGQVTTEYYYAQSGRFIGSEP